MKSVVIPLALVFSSQLFAFTIPSAPSSPSGYDEIRTSDGTTCRSSVGGNLQLYGGVVDANGYSDNHGDYYNRNDDGERAGYVGFAYSFGSKERIRCDRLAEIETERAQLELQKLKSEIAALEQIRKLKQLEAMGQLPPLVKK